MVILQLYLLQYLLFAFEVSLLRLQAHPSLKEISVAIACSIERNVVEILTCFSFFGTPACLQVEQQLLHLR